jgi:hypothetical protein
MEPYDDASVTGEGFFARAEYVFGESACFGLRTYAGILLTGRASSDDFHCRGINRRCEVTAKLGLLGAAARLAFRFPG